MIDMARGFHLEMAAQGVETDAQAQLLAQRGVWYAQERLFGKPMPIEALICEMEKPVMDELAMVGERPLRRQ